MRVDTEVLTDLGDPSELRRFLGLRVQRSMRRKLRAKWVIPFPLRGVPLSGLSLTLVSRIVVFVRSTANPPIGNRSMCISVTSQGRKTYGFSATPSRSAMVGSKRAMSDEEGGKE